MLLLVAIACSGPSAAAPASTVPDATHPVGPTSTLAPAAGGAAMLTQADPFARWNELLEPQPWWRDSAPYSCHPPAKLASPWLEAGMRDIGGADPLSLIRFYGNGSYLRYGYMGFEGCTTVKKYPGRTHLDPPVDPTYYSTGNLDIAVDIARVPPDAPGWFEDDGIREVMTLAEAVRTLNTHIVPYFLKISEANLNMRFHPGVDFALEGEGSPDDVLTQQLRLAGIIDCPSFSEAHGPCSHGAPGGLNRILLTDVTSDRGGSAHNGSARFGLVSLREADMTLLAHEIGHSWMNWPHSYAEVPWHPDGIHGRDDESAVAEPPNPYSNALDFMSTLSVTRVLGWHQDLPSTLAVNRYAAGWIDPSEVALHLEDAATYTLHPPRQRGYQFLVVSSGRRYAFTTIEVLDKRNSAYIDETPKVHDPSYPEARRPFRYSGVLVSRYDQSTGAGAQARFGPALYDARNPDFAADVGWGRDDYSVLRDGDSRSIGGGVFLQVSVNPDQSYRIAVSGGRIAPFPPWCVPLWFVPGEYDSGCLLNELGPIATPSG